MDLLEIPLEALAFRYSAAVAGSLWAWLAVLTAALSLWRIRSSGSKPVSLPSDPYPKPAQAEAQPSTPPRCHVDDAGTPAKARFTTYYHLDECCHLDGGAVVTAEEEECDGNGDGVETEVDGNNGTLGYSDSGFGWEEFMPVKRITDLGWYRYQDIAALNGSVVRLWDGPLTARDVRLRG